MCIFQECKGLHVGVKVQLYKGADGPEAKKLLNRRQMLLKFLSGKSTEKESLQRNHPEMYK